MESGLKLNVSRAYRGLQMLTHRDQQAQNRESQQTRRHLRDRTVINLLLVLQSTYEERHSQNEK